GNPVANANVTFKLTNGMSLHLQNLVNDATTTDNDGIASVTYNAFPIQGFLGFESETVTASWNGLNVDLGVIITQVPAGEWAAPPLFHIDAPMDAPPELGTAKAGSVVSNALQITGVFQQGPSYGQGVPGFGVRLTDPMDSLKASDVSCVGGTA